MKASGSRLTGRIPLARTEALPAEDLLRWATDEFASRLCLTCSWQKQSSVLVHMVTELGLALDIVELVMAMEEKFEIEIPDEDAEKIQTVRDAINYIQERQ